MLVVYSRFAGADIPRTTMDSTASAHGPTPLDDFWSRIDDHLRARLNPDLYGRWFAALRPMTLEGDRLVWTARIDIVNSARYSRVR